MAVYLEMTHFNDERYYQIHVEDDAFTEDKIYGPRNAGGVTVYSECCADTMSLDVVRKVHAALGEYLAAHDAEGWRAEPIGPAAGRGLRPVRCPGSGVHRSAE